MAEVQLYKKTGTYPKDGVDKPFTNFYLKCGDTLIPIEVSYFENKELGRDPQYQGRKMVLTAFAEMLPDKPGKGKKADKPDTAADSDVPF